MGGCTVFHGGCAVFWGRCAVFQGRCAVFCCGTALTYKLCILLLLDYFHPRNDGFVSCLPFTEHVQTLFTLNWACANSLLGMCRNNLHNLPCFWQFWLITMTETEHEHRLRLVDLTTSRYQDVFAFFFTFFQLLSFIFLCYIFLSLVQTLEARLPGSDLLLVRVISTFETYYVMMENELTFVTLSL